MNMKETIMSNKTIFILEFYLLFTFILYLTGPFEYSYLNLWNMVFLVAAYQVALFYGYYYAKKKDFKGDNNKVIIFNDKNYLVVLMGLTCLSILINYIHI